MTPTLRVDLATLDDLAALGQLRVAVGWLPNVDLLQALWAWEQARIFIVREETLTAGGSSTPIGATCATATDGIGVIGNVHVRSDYQRRGLARLLMDVALDWQRKQGVQSVYLDATAEGRPLYTKLGFVGLERSWAVHGPLATLDLGALNALAHHYTNPPRINYSSAEALPRLAALDGPAYGGNRLELLERLLALPDHALLTAEDASGQMVGYLLARLLEPPSCGVRVGPWVAQNSEIAAMLLTAALAEDAPWRAAITRTGDTNQYRLPNISISLPASSAPAMELLRAISAPLEEDDLIMRLDFTPGVSAAPTAPATVYAWLAPMVF